MKQPWLNVFILLPMISLISLCSLSTYCPGQEMPPPISSPWVALKEKPPIDGAIGILNFHFKPDSMRVWWVTSKTWEKVGEKDLLVGGGYKGLNRGDYCSQVLVFDLKDKWALVHSSDDKHGWGWVWTAQGIKTCYTEEAVSLVQLHLKERVKQWCESTEGTKEGYVTSHSGVFIELPAGPLRSRPEDNSPVVFHLPENWRWKSARWKEKGLASIKNVHLQENSDS